MRVAIVGGGIGGLASAGALHRDGWSVNLFERERDPSGDGTALGIWPSALRALDRLGIGAAVRERATAQRLARFVRPDGHSIGRIDAASLVRRTGDPVYLLSRPALLELLRSAAAASSLHFGSAVDDVRTLTDEYDLVVAADGVFSRARTTLLGDAYRAAYAGVAIWRGWIDDRPTEDMTEVWGRGAKFGVTPQEGGRTNWYAATAAPEGSFAPGRELARLHEVHDGWCDPVRSVLGQVTEASILRHDLYVAPRLHTFIPSGVALIGDAAHAMCPDLGRGACEAVIDAVTLAGCLRDRGVEEGLRAYDRQRRPVTRRLTRTSSAASRLTRWRRARWLRDGLLRLSLLLPPPP